jgi:hypothetical protein
MVVGRHAGVGVGGVDEIEGGICRRQVGNN